MTELPQECSLTGGVETVESAFLEAWHKADDRCVDVNGNVGYRAMQGLGNTVHHDIFFIPER